MTNSLTKKGFTQSVVDSPLFTKNENGIFIALTIYMDDVIVASYNEKEVKDIKEYLHDCFSIKDLGKLKYILGIEIARNSKGILLYQRKYILDLLAEYGFWTVNLHKLLLQLIKVTKTILIS